MYKRVLELRAEGLSYSQIIRKIEEEFGERLSKSVVSFWCRGIHRPVGKVRYELKPSADLGWLLGAAIGDGKKRFLHRSGYYTIELEGKPEIVELFARTAAKVVGRGSLPIYPAKRGLIRAGFKSIRLYYLLSDFDALVELVESSEEVKRGFLGGLWDTEGCITKNGELLLYNSNLQLLRRVQKWHGDFGIEATGPHLNTKRGKKFRDPETGKEYEQKRDVFYIYVRARSLETFAREIGFRVERKRRRLEEAIERRRKRGEARVSREPPTSLIFPNSVLT